METTRGREFWIDRGGTFTAVAGQDGPRLFDRRIVLSELLYSRVIEARERVDACGESL